MNSLAVIFPAAGRSMRFGGRADKLLEPLAGTPVLEHSLSAFLSRDDVACVVISCRPDRVRAEAQAFAGAAESLRKKLDDPRVRLVAGGDCRAASVLLALRAVPEEIEWVAVHDAARPLVSQGVINRTLAAALTHGAAAPALAVSLTIKEANGPLPAPVRRTVPRTMLWAMQTPQIMRREALLSAFAACPVPLDSITDDAQLLELSGQAVWLVDGDERNLKITTALDIRVAELCMKPIDQ